MGRCFCRGGVCVPWPLQCRSWHVRPFLAALRSTATFQLRNVNWVLKIEAKANSKGAEAHPAPQWTLTSTNFTALPGNVHRKRIWGTVERRTGHPSALHGPTLRRERQRGLWGVLGTSLLQRTRGGNAVWGIPRPLHSQKQSFPSSPDEPVAPQLLFW